MMEWGPDQLERGKMPTSHLTGYPLLDIGPMLWSLWFSWSGRAGESLLSPAYGRNPERLGHARLQEWGEEER
ncbi:MAG: hypothetical protein C4327_11820 [Meiothermus sp.]